MKDLFLKTLAVSLLVSANAFAGDDGEEQTEEAPNYVIELDWNKPSTLHDSVVQMCDDSYYNEIEIVIPGKAKKDFAISMDVSINSGKVVVGCEVRKKDGRNSTTYFLNPSNGGCKVEVYQFNPNNSEKPKTAVYEISDAC